MMKLCTYLVITVLFACSSKLLAQESEVRERMRTDWRVRGQFAGFQGLVSVGAGPVLAKGVWRPTLMYGFAPPAGGRTAVHQFILRNDVVFFPGQRNSATWLSPTASLNLLVETGRHSFLTLPERFPRGYYMAPLPRFTFGLGGRLNRELDGFGPFRQFAFTAEAVALDAYLWYGLSERGFPLHRAFGLSFGVELLW